MVPPTYPKERNTHKSHTAWEGVSSIGGRMAVVGHARGLLVFGTVMDGIINKINSVEVVGGRCW